MFGVSAVGQSFSCAILFFMDIFFWIIVFIIALSFLVKGADWFLDGAQKIGESIGLSAFVIGVVIVGFGTSLPELVSSLFGVWQGVPELVVANVVGSNLANILLIVGLSAIVGGQLSVSKNLIDLDIPILSVTTIFAALLIWDGVITRADALLLLFAFVIFLVYSVRNGGEAIEVRQLFHFAKEPPAIEIRGFNDTIKQKASISSYEILWTLIGLASLLLGAKYVVDAVIALSGLFGIGVGVISLFAVAVGTSLPELIVSMKAAWQQKAEVALGNIFGSNVFNLLFIIGIPGLFATLPVDEATLLLGLPVMLVATFFLIISGISQRVHSYEGALFVLVYVFFVGRLFGVL